MIDWLARHLSTFRRRRARLGPDTDAPGLLAAGGDLSLQRLRAAYSRGIFPWYGPGQPPLWWSPDPRMVLQTKDFKLARSLRKAVQRFAASAGLRDPRGQRHRRGAARLRRRAARGPVRHLDPAGDAGRLPGLGPAGHGPQRRDLDRRRTGRRALRRQPRSHVLRRIDVHCAAPTPPRSRWPRWSACAGSTASAGIDCQQNTRHLASLGAAEVPRAAFEAHLQETVGQPSPTDWSYHPRLWDHLFSGSFLK